MANDYTVRIKTYERTDLRLGRNVRHDSRSLLYLVAPEPRSTLSSIHHHSTIPVLDQGNLGSCTGNAATKNMSYGEFWVGQGELFLSREDAYADELVAISVYSDATALDPYAGTYPPDDSGSDGLSVAQVLKKRGVISGYRHATSLDAVLTALSQQAVITGTVWRTDMFEPDETGRIHITGNDEGGHEYVLDELDMENKRIWMQNSWGPGWGINGRAWYTFDDFEALLKADGDVTVFVPINEPAPAPTPTPTASTDEQFAAAAHSWLKKNPFFYKSTIQKSLKTWLEKKNL